MQSNLEYPACWLPRNFNGVAAACCGQAHACCALHTPAHACMWAASKGSVPTTPRCHFPPAGRCCIAGGRAGGAQLAGAPTTCLAEPPRSHAATPLHCTPMDSETLYRLSNLEMASPLYSCQHQHQHPDRHLFPPTAVKGWNTTPLVAVASCTALRRMDLCGWPKYRNPAGVGRQVAIG